MTANIHIAPATPADVPFIAALIRELAEYENLAGEVSATEERIRSTMFGERPVAESVIAALNGTPVGFAVFFPTYSTFRAQPGLYLEDVFVRPDARRLGVGRTLLEYLARLTVARGWGRLEWRVLDWNAPAIAFYRSLGAEPLDDWTVFRLAGEALETLGARTRWYGQSIHPPPITQSPS